MWIREFGSLKLPPEGLGGIHPFHEILFIESGSSEFVLMNQTYTFTSYPVLILIPANTPHWLVPVSEGSTGWFIEFDIQDDPFMDNEIVSLWNQDQAKYGKKKWPPVMVNEIQSVQDLLAKYEGSIIDWNYVHQILELSIQKFRLMIGRRSTHHQYFSSTDHGQFQEMDRHIYTVLRHMERSYAEPITLEDLSEMCNFAPSHIIRLFKENTGSTPIQYLQKLRLNAAISYLELTDLPIQEIAKITGFPNLHYFSRIFKRKNGISPSGWRAQVHVFRPITGSE